jgi:predicted ATPase/DNA-binding SARP family transcriptional activator/Tfp pilus assembly protein PilF
MSVLRLLGEAQFNDMPVPLERVTFLIAVLTCREHWVSRGELVLSLWTEVSEDLGRKRLRQLLYRARGFDFATGLIADPNRVRFDGFNDVRAFREAIKQERWSDAIALYRGEFLKDLSLSDQGDLGEMLMLERENLAVAYRQAVQKAVSSLETTQAASMLEAAVNLEPLSEDLLNAYFQICANLERRQQIFAIHVKALRAIDLEPSETLLAKLGEKSRAGELPLPTHVPIPATALIGRHSELQLIAQRLDDPNCRLITLVGVGGAGKTRLAMTVATQDQQRFEGGACFVPLVGVNSLDLVPDSLLEALAISSTGNTTMQLLEVLAKRELLLVLDNLEHLPGMDMFVAMLLEKCPGLRILATSREAFGLSFENLIEIEGLPAPDHLFPLETQDAALLFLKAAQRVNPKFHFGNDIESFSRIYRAVSGIPLGLELAASWVRALELSDIASELEKSLDLLEVDSADVPIRQRSFAATFRYSWVLLSQTEKNALARLSVLRGSFSREWALTVGGASLNVLLGLINKSMLSKRDSRFFLHELIRQYAFLELSSDAEHSAMMNLSELCLALSRAWYPERNSNRHSEMSRRVELELDNLRPALGWCLTHNPRLGAETVGLLEHFWNTRGHHREGLSWGQRFAACVETQVPDWVRAHLLWMIASLGKEQSQYEVARAAIVEYQAIGVAMGNRQLDANSQKFFGLIERDLGNLEVAKNHFERAISLHEEYGNVNQIAMCNNDLGLVLMYQNQFEAAKVCFTKALELKRSLNDPIGAAYSLGHLGSIAGLQGDAALELSLLEESLRVKREAGDVQGTANGLQALGNLARRNGQYVLARAYLTEALQSVVRLGRQWAAAHVLVDFAQLEHQIGQTARALHLLIAAEAALTRIGSRLNERVKTSSQYLRLEHGLSAAQCSNIEAQAVRSSLEAAIAFALETVNDELFAILT